MGSWHLYWPFSEAGGFVPILLLLFRYFIFEAKLAKKVILQAYIAAF